MVDIIIPVWKLDGYRKANLKNTMMFWEGQQGIDCKVHIIDPDTDEFNKQWQCNIGVRKSDGERIIIADVDVVHNSRTYLAEFMLWMDYHKLRWAFGWNRVIYDGKDGGKPERDDWPEPGINEGCIVCFERSLWEEFGGANEWIRELRGPDNELAMKARYLTGTHMGFPEKLRHQWHPRSQMKSTQYKKANREVLKYTRRNMKQVIGILRKQDWGNLNGSYCKQQSFFEARGGK